MFWTDGVGDGGPYTQDQMRLFGRVCTPTNKKPNVGVVGGYLNGLLPSGGGLDQISVDTGSALVDGRPYENDLSKVIVLTRPVVGATGKRILLQADWATRTIRAVALSSADGTAALPGITQTDGVKWETPLASFTHGLDGTISALTDEREFVNYRPFQFLLDGGGAVLEVGQKGYLSIPDDCELFGWQVLADAVGSVQIDVWKDTYTNFPPTVADTICGSDKPRLVAVQKNRNLNIACETQWPKRFTRGDVLSFNVDSSATVTRVLLTLWLAG